MSTLREVENAMNREQSPALQKEIDYIPEAILTEEQNPVNTEFVIFKLANLNKDGGVHIPGIDYVIDPRTITPKKLNGNGPEMIRLINGVTAILDKEMLEVEMVALASQQPIEKIKPHAFYLGIKFDDEYGRPKPENRLKAE